MATACCKTETKQKLLTRTFTVSVCGNVVLVAVLIILFIVRQTLRNQEPPTTAGPPPPTPSALKENAGQICLPCTFNGMNIGDTLYEFTLKTKDNNTMCCLQPDKTLQNLIIELEEINRGIRYYDRQINPRELQWWRERNHAAHLYVNPYSTSKGMTWREQGCKTSFLRNLTLTNDGRRLTIPDFAGAGMYFVYSFHTIDLDSEAHGRHAPIGIHNVYHYKSAFIRSPHKPLLWTAKLGGENTTKRHTSFLCGVVKMNKKDSIETEALRRVAENLYPVNNRDKPYANYFGMFKLIDFF